MEVKRIYRKLAPMARKLKDIALVSSIVIISSCSDELPVPGGSADGPSAQPRTYVEVPLSLIVGSADGGTRAICDDGTIRDLVDDAGDNTRAIDDNNNQGTPDDGKDTQIKDVIIIQFDGKEEDDPVAVECVKIDDYQVEANRTVKLVARSGYNLIMAIANTGDDPYLASNINTGDNGQTSSKLSDVRKLVKTVFAQQDVFGYPTDVSSDQTLTFPDNATFRPIMNGMVEVDHVNTDTYVEIDLKRNSSRIDFNLTVLNSLDIHSIELCNVPNLMNYVTNYTVSSDHKWPTTSTFQTNTYTPSNSDWKTTAEDVADGKKYHARFYMPASTRGSVAACTDPKTRLSYAPEQSPYVRILAKTDAGEAFIYTFHLGENMTTDFNLRPNYKYYYDIKINTLNPPAGDNRVVKYPKLEDFTPITMGRSNCYILNPSPIPGIVRHFRIPIDRIDEFWGAAYDEDKYEDNVLVKASDAPYECVHANCLYADQHWTADVIWSDFKLNPTIGEESTTQVSLITASGTKGCKDYIEISVPHGASGNFTIGVKKTDTSGTITSDILWSWHLWVTDYNPYPAKNYPIVSGKTDYQVPGGKTHRPMTNSGVDTNATLFQSGVYKKSFLLDRTIGWVDNTYDGVKKYSGSVRGCLYYQYGRKDPLYSGTKYKLDGTNVSLTSASCPEDENSIRYSIVNPTIMIIGNPWCPDSEENPNKYNPNSADAYFIIWNDPNVNRTNYHQDTGLVNEKSLFDPSPLNMSLPVKGGTTSNIIPVAGLLSTGFGISHGTLPHIFYAICDSYSTQSDNYGGRAKGPQAIIVQPVLYIK